jgi:hypothetical protein
MPEDVPTMGLSGVLKSQHRRSEASLSDDSSTVPTMEDASPLTSSDARIRTGGRTKLGVGHGDWTIAGRRTSQAGAGPRRSKFDIRHDNMLASLLKKRKRPTMSSVPSPPLTNLGFDRVSPGEPSASSSSSSFSFSNCDREDTSRVIQPAPSADSTSTRSPSSRPNASSHSSSLRRSGATTNSIREATPSSRKVCSDSRPEVSIGSSPEAVTRVNPSLEKVGNKPEVNVSGQGQTAVESGDGAPLSLVSASLTMEDNKKASSGIVATEKSDETECASLVSGDSNEEEGFEPSQGPANCDGAGRGDADGGASEQGGSSGIAGDGALVEERIAMTVGTRVEVYWDGEGQYFAGTLTKESSRHNRGDCFFIEYDDGDKEWIHLDREIYRLEENPKPKRTTDGGSNTFAAASLKRSKARRDSRRSQRSGPTANGVASPELSKKDAVLTHERGVSSDSVASGQSSVDSETTSTNAQQAKSSIPGANAARDAPTTKAKVAGRQPTMGNICDGPLTPGTKIGETALPIVVHSSVGPDLARVVTRDAAEAKIGSGTFTQEEESWVQAGIAKRSPEDSSDSETDEEEVMNWAAKMFGIAPRPIARRKSPTGSAQSRESMVGDMVRRFGSSDEVFIPISEAVKLGRRRRSVSLNFPAPPGVEGRQKRHEYVVSVKEAEEERSKRRKEEAKPLTQAEVRAILSHDLCPEAASQHWVRRSMRQPSRSALDSPQVKALLDKLRTNDTDMVVLKLKKYVSDPNAPQIVLDAVLDALEENTNCEALYIQVRTGVTPVPSPFLT